MEISPFKIFNIYAHEDRHFLEALKKHVSILIRKKAIEFWYDAEIIAGQNWDETIKKNLAQADIILVFVSADFISSEYIQTVELEKALKRHHSGESVVVPIIARSCSWYHEEELTKLEALPEKAKPIKSWQDADEAYENISNGLQRLIETLRQKRLTAEQAIVLKEEDAAALSAVRQKINSIAKAEAAVNALIAEQERLEEEARKKQEAEVRAALPPSRGTEGGLPEMIRIEGGTFDMGDTFGDGDASEKPVHRVTLGDFYLGKYAVTLAQFKVFIEDSGYKTDAEKDGGSTIWNGTDWKKIKDVNWRCDVNGKIRSDSEHNHPVIHVSWNDAKACADWYSKKTGQKLRLPTEAEWEYAARAVPSPLKGGKGGGKVRFGNGKDIADPKEINFYAKEDAKQSYSVVGEFRGKTVPVDSFQPNALGLYQMSGNVWEWCEDWHHSDYNGAPSDDSAWLSPTGSFRVVRGGSWGDFPQGVRAAVRLSDAPGVRDYIIGFRLARTI